MGLKIGDQVCIGGNKVKIITPFYSTTVNQSKDLRMYISAKLNFSPVAKSAKFRMKTQI